MRIYFESLVSSKMFRVLCIVIVLDTIFGVLRAIRERSLNSTIGIDGIIRKVGMLISALFLGAIDFEININLIKFVPEVIKELIKTEYIGFNELFNFLFILFELLSVLKNMTLCKLPIPKEWQKYLESFIKTFTNEFVKVYKMNISVSDKKGDEEING